MLELDLLKTMDSKFLVCKFGAGQTMSYENQWYYCFEDYCLRFKKSTIWRKSNWSANKRTLEDVEMH